MSAHKSFSELSLKNHQFKNLALASAILLVAVIAMLVLELIGANAERSARARLDMNGYSR